MTPNIADIIRHHVSLEVRCIDRLYLNAYMPKLQTSGGLCYFLRDYLGHPIPSPALFKPMHDRFVDRRGRVRRPSPIPVVHFASGQDKDAIVAEVSGALHRSRGRRHPRRCPREDARLQGPQTDRPGREGPLRVLAPMGGGQSVLLLCPRPRLGSGVSEDRHVSAVSRETLSQRSRVGEAATAAPTPSVREPRQRLSLLCRSVALQTACDALGPADVQAFFDRWSHRLPWPLPPTDRRAGYDHRLAINQLEVSLTQVFDRPVQGRYFFEAVIRENLDLGRPDRVRLLFPMRLTRATPPPPCRLSHARHHGRRATPASRSNTNTPTSSSTSKSTGPYEPRSRSTTRATSGSGKGSANLPHLCDLGQQVNRKLLEVERVSHHCVLTRTPSTAAAANRGAGQARLAFRFGDPRVDGAPPGHLPASPISHAAFATATPPPIEALLGRSYTAAQMTYDLRRLRLKGLIHRIPNDTPLYRDQLRSEGRLLLRQTLSPHLSPELGGATPRRRSVTPLPPRRPRRLDLEITKIHEEAALAA